jgi:heterodisulfide reductase subunit B
MKYAYFPGCTLEASAKEYGLSFKAVFGRLNIDFEEIKDWNCCGALESSSINPKITIGLCVRNLKLARSIGDALIIPCSACLSNHLKTKRYLEEMEGNLSNEYQDLLPKKDILNFRIVHPLGILIREIGLKIIRGIIDIPLKIKVAPYYGCLSLRPSTLTDFDNPENPTSLEELFCVCGAQVVQIQFKTRCCGGALLMTNESLTLELSGKILSSAIDQDADCIATICPMCQIALESLQEKLKRQGRLVKEIPILYFTQILGLAMGLSPKDLAFNKNLISTKEIIEKVV